MMIQTTIDGEQIEPRFGIEKAHFPRFAVIDTDAQALGFWTDRQETAFAVKKTDGYRSVYLGAAPVPAGVLRWLAKTSNVGLWSDQADIISATTDVTCLVATTTGERTLRLPKAQRPAFGGKAHKKHRLDLAFGDVRIFVAE